VRELHLAAGTTRSRAWATRGGPSNRGRRPFIAFRKRGERWEYPLSAMMTARTSGAFVCSALGAKQFKL